MTRAFIVILMVVFAGAIGYTQDKTDTPEKVSGRGNLAADWNLGHPDHD